MCTEIHHRSPDDRGSSVCPQQGIGMIRLSIIDLEGGHQPIWFNEKVSVVITDTDRVS